MEFIMIMKVYMINMHNIIDGDADKELYFIACKMLQHLTVQPYGWVRGIQTYSKTFVLSQD